MRVLLGMGVVVGFCFACCHSASAVPIYPAAMRQSALAVSAIQEAQYTYRRTKHGYERCYHRNRFGTRSWRSLFWRIPDC